MQFVNTHLTTFYNLLASVTVADQRSSSGVQINSGFGELPNINQEEEDVITTAFFGKSSSARYILVLGLCLNTQETNRFDNVGYQCVVINMYQ